MTLFERSPMEGPRLAGTWGCGAGRGRICVTTDGSIYGCAKVIGLDRFDDTHKLGDVWQGITNWEHRLELMDNTSARRPQCANCAYSSICCGGCPATNYDANGSIFIPDPLECRYTAMVARLKDRLEELQCHCVDNP